MNRSKPLLLVASALTLLVACAHEPPRELVAARSAYEQAATGPAQKYTPADLHVARESLVRAEQLFDDKGSTSVVRDQAYIAWRQAELASTFARTAMLEQEVGAAAWQTRQLNAQEAARTRSELEVTRDALVAQKAAGAATREALVAERQRREAAEARAAKALTALALLAPVKQDERGTVITLSGSVLFASGKSALLPAARSRLTQVADALQSGDPDAIYVVEGHTDSRGSSALNQRLSLARANSVRDYLVERGITADRIRAEGHGSDRPIADNGAAEGRANNRRVEIVVKPGTSA